MDLESRQQVHTYVYSPSTQIKKLQCKTQERGGVHSSFSKETRVSFYFPPLRARLISRSKGRKSTLCFFSCSDISFHLFFSCCCCCCFGLGARGRCCCCRCRRIRRTMSPSSSSLFFLPCSPLWCQCNQMGEVTTLFSLSLFHSWRERERERTKLLKATERTRRSKRLLLRFWNEERSLETVQRERGKHTKCAEGI